MKQLFKTVVTYKMRAVPTELLQLITFASEACSGENMLNQHRSSYA